MSTDLKDRIKALVADDLRLIEEALVAHLSPHYPLVESIAGHILFAGGKRLRPLLMLLSARICGDFSAEAVSISVLFEYLHAATLIHDDVVDVAAVRRGKPSAHTVFGPAEAVLTGDFLLARSLSLAARTGLPRVIAVIAKITEDMSQGEIQQLANKGRLDLSEAEYMDVIDRKTAVMIRGACLTGALLSGADPDREAALTDYGQSLGLAFQMADDLLDYTADTATLGKNVGADLREGKLTLPIIYALTRADRADRLWMEGLMGTSDLDVETFQRFIRLLDHYGGLSYTRRLAGDHVRRAKAALERFEPSRPRMILELLADYALVRNA
ncbi:polyprenyl synthetase family protein [Desulfatiferula olefinivorans]